jgi:ABC-type transport system involved in cytochrome c biogenesis permease component
MILPILAREARRAAQRPAIYRFRLASVFIAVFTAAYLLAPSGLWTSSAAVGRDIFQILVWLGFAFCLLAGVLFASGLLCQERRDGSLALLFLTRLTGLDVVVGKLTAILLVTCQVALGLFPVLALCIPLGGVSIGEFWRAAAALLATLVLSLGIGLFVSALNRELSRSVLISFAAITIPTAIIGFLDALIRQSFPGTHVGAVLPGLVPLMTSLLDPQYVATPGAFESLLASQFILAALLLMLGGRMLKRLSIQGPPAPSPRAHIIHSRCAMPAQERRELLHRNPVYWISQRHRWRWLSTWTIFCLLIVIWFYALEYFRFAPAARLVIICAIAPLLHLLLKVSMAAESASRLAGARGGELELLLSTPLTSGQIIRGQQRGLMRQFLWPIITMLAVDLIFALTYGRVSNQRDDASIFGYLFIYTLGVSMIIDAPALAWVGLWQGLRCDKTIQAVHRAILQVIALPLIIYFLSLAVIVGPLFALLQPSALDSPPSSVWSIGLILWWFLLSFVSNTLIGRNAQFHLKTFLRFIAADPRAADAMLDPATRRRRAQHIPPLRGLRRAGA